MAGGPHEITMADTPSRPVSFARTVEIGVERRNDSDHEDVTCEAADTRTSNPSTMHVVTGVEQGSVVDSVDEQRPSKIDECDKAKNERFHSEICYKLASIFPDLCFVKAHDNSGNSMVVITQRTLMFHPPMGFTSRIQVTIRGSEYEVHVMLRKAESGMLESIMDAQELCNRFSVKSNYKFCPGIDPQHYRSYYLKPIQFNSLTVRQTLEPFDRIDILC